MSKTQRFTMTANPSTTLINRKAFGVRVISSHHGFHSVGEITSQAARFLALVLCAAANTAERNTSRYAETIRRRSKRR